MEEFIQQRVELDKNTKAVCTKCGREDAPLLYLRRKKGLYEALCFDSGKGCFPNSSRILCEHVDHEGFNCLQMAEYEVVDGIAGLTSRKSCSEHLGHFLGQQSAYNIYPLD